MRRESEKRDIQKREWVKKKGWKINKIEDIVWYKRKKRNKEINVNNYFYKNKNIPKKIIEGLAVHTPKLYLHRFLCFSFSEYDQKFNINTQP